MNRQHNKPVNGNCFEDKEEQRGLLCCSKRSFRCSSLCYHYKESPERLERAFDILFEVVLGIDEDNKS